MAAVLDRWVSLAGRSLDALLGQLELGTNPELLQDAYVLTELLDATLGVYAADFGFSAKEDPELLELAAWWYGPVGWSARTRTVCVECAASAEVASKHLAVAPGQVIERDVVSMWTGDRLAVCCVCSRLV